MDRTEQTFRHRFKCTNPQCKNTKVVEVDEFRDAPYKLKMRTNWKSDPNVVWGFLCPKCSPDKDI